jgi:hypothetical protein
LCEEHLARCSAAYERQARAIYEQVVKPLVEWRSSMDEPKLCPFCGKRFLRQVHQEGYEPEVSCNYISCPIQKITMRMNEWNTRPLEDALRAKNERLKDEIACMELRMEEQTRNYRIGSNAGAYVIKKLKAEKKTLLERIAIFGKYGICPKGRQRKRGVCLSEDVCRACWEEYLDAEAQRSMRG